MQDNREAIVEWVSAHILPHEAPVRAWLRRSLNDESDVEDVVQEAYCHIAQLATVEHIRNGRAYFFATVRSIVLQRVRRERVVKIETMTDFDALNVVEDAPCQERVAGARRELERVLRLIGDLPAAYRRVIELRRIHGLSQRQTAQALGVTERVVENNLVRGLRMILRALAEDGHAPAESEGRGHERRRNRARH